MLTCPRLRRQPHAYEQQRGCHDAAHVGAGFSFCVEDEADRAEVNESSVHIDFMIGSPEVTVTGITPGGDRVPVLVAGAWQI